MPQTRQEIRRRSYLKHREARIAKATAAAYLRRYGITVEQYQDILQKQDGICAICKNPPNKNALAVDHCHITGKIRGLLCPSCNSGIGKLRDSPEMLRKAIEYLEKTNAY